MGDKKCNLCYVRRLLGSAASAKSAREAPKYDNGVSTPPMGWSSWNCFRNNIDEDKILEIADAMVKTGLAEKGYRFLNLDDNWHSSMRDENGRLQGDLVRFSSGIPELVKRINARGLKAGLYCSNGELTCEDLPGGLGHERTDANTLASWGVEFFKYDFCHHKRYTGKAPAIAGAEFALLSDRRVRISLSPEDGILGGAAVLRKDGKMPGGTRVDGLNRNRGILIFDSVEAECPGEYVVTLITKKRDRADKYIAIEANGEMPELAIVPGCNPFNLTARTQAIVKLKKGKNVIRLYNPFVRHSDSYVYQYRNMGYLLKEATKRVSSDTHAPEKPITFSICEWGMNRPYLWGATAGNLWRTTLDIRPWWRWIMWIYRHNLKLYEYVGKGGYNDPDMLETGNGKLTLEENRAHFTLWCMLNAPLILGNDLRKFVGADGKANLDDPILKIISDADVISLDQDELSLSCKKVRGGLVDILAKPLKDGVAFCALNKTRRKRKIRFDVRKYASDAYLRLERKDSYRAFNLWTKEEFETDGTIATEAEGHGVAVFKLF